MSSKFYLLFMSPKAMDAMPTKKKITKKELQMTLVYR